MDAFLTGFADELMKTAAGKHGAGKRVVSAVLRHPVLTLGGATLAASAIDPSIGNSLKNALRSVKHKLQDYAMDEARDSANYSTRNL